MALVVFAPHESRAQDNEEEAPLALELSYTGDIWTLASGGDDHSVRYLDNLDIILNADLETLIGADNTTASVYALYNNGASFSGDIVGDALTISNIEAPVEAFRLYEAWVEHRFGGGPISARIGLYDLNSEFDALETSSFFIGSAHGIGADISQSGESGPSIFPITSLALRLDYEVSDSFSLRVAALDGVAGDPDRLKRTAIKLSENDGALTIVEGDYRRRRFRVIGGAWRYTSPTERLDRRGLETNYGVYIRGEGSLIVGASGAKKLSGFFRAGWANGSVNDFSQFYATGLVYNGPFLSSGDDQLGIAIAYAGTSNSYRIENPASSFHETVTELSYRAPVTDWFVVQPNIQYVVNPGLGPSARNALAVGVRMEIGGAREFGR